MLTEEENRILTQVGPGTPMGELLRRYWHPIASADDLARDSVRPVRLMGEDLTLFRTEAGDLGLVTDRCAHRGISLAYGIPQANGLRCAYHGWTYDTEGRVVEMPFEPACLPLRIRAYRAQELGGLIFAYMGPEPAPLLPRWDVLVRDDLKKTARFTALPCNWLQCMDNSLDPIHFEYLHGIYGNYVMKRAGKPPMVNPARHVRIDFDVFKYGIYKRRLVEGQSEDVTDWTMGTPILFPNILAGVAVDGSAGYQFRVPVDDSHALNINYNGAALPVGERGGLLTVKHEPLQYDDAGRIVATYITRQDEMAWVAQGPISDRTTEHLATSDKGILLYRKVIHENIERVARGEDPMGVIRDPAENFPMITIDRKSTLAAFKVGVTENLGGPGYYVDEAASRGPGA
ncbi:MAG TPA: Rieske 2Fe-2S domain-containing protein [Chloroflexota bacterium]|nr:Rieske 2Fe-2S domain-containing protein [Chloroflexota bacterium]